jgi:hypothetical protein
LFGNKCDVAQGRSRLINRPGMANHLIDEFTYPWGNVLSQRSKGAWYAPASHDGVSHIPVGRPVVRGHEFHSSTTAFADWVHQQGSIRDHGSAINDRLSGMYAIFECANDAVTVMTDHMGFRPVYCARNREGGLLGIGTHIESLAAATGLEKQIDLVSLGELCTHNHITFPYTTRVGIIELDPCSINSFDTNSNELQSNILWEPTEPSVFPSKTEIKGMLKEALVQAGQDITRGCSNAAVLLSGGIDSRAVIGVLPSDRLGGALTYVTRENRETRVAGEVAVAAGTNQTLVQRDEHYFPNLVKRGLHLIGMELRGNCHGLCIVDNNLQDQFDVVVGGQLSDTLLKDHFMPFTMRDVYRPRSIQSHIKQFVLGKKNPVEPNPSHTTGRHVLEKYLTPDIRDQVRIRREVRLEQVSKVRPTTAIEWHRFWPCSRQDDSSHTLGNARVMCSDTLFAHQSIVEVSCVYDPKLRVDGSLTDSIFIDLCGPLAEIMNANTGLAANASEKQILAKRNEDRKERLQRTESSQDWNQVETSWANPIAMQEFSPTWIELRDTLSGSSALSMLDQVIERGGEQMISAYQHDLPSTFNHISMQIAIWLDQIFDHEHNMMREAAG